VQQILANWAIQTKYKTTVVLLVKMYQMPKNTVHAKI